MKRLVVAVLLSVVLLSSLGLQTLAAAPRVTYRIGEQTATEAIGADGTVELFEPDTALLGGKLFVGWVLLEGTEQRFLPAGAVYTHVGTQDLVFEALTVDLQTLSGAAVSLGDVQTLRFDGAIDKNDYARLVELFGAENITLGVLTARYSQVYGGKKTFALDCGAESLLVHPSREFTYSTQTANMFIGRTAAISNEHLLEKYAGRAYLTVGTGADAVTVYAAFDPLIHARTVHGVTAAAYDRRAQTPHVVYTDAQEQTLIARLDRVVNVQMEGSGVSAGVIHEYSLTNLADSFVPFTTYRSPYTLLEVRGDSPKGYDTYVIIGVDGADFSNISAYFIGGSTRLPKGTECTEDGYCIAVRNHTQ